MRARIVWKTKDEGGRANLPTGTDWPPYSPIVRFPDHEESWPEPSIWSLVVEKIPDQSQGMNWLADVRYSVENAPHQELRPNRRFELYEGKRCVAEGVLLGE